MAEITPVTPVVPAAPAASAAPVAAPGGAPTAPGQDFLSQLSGALKTLKGLAGAVTGAGPLVTPVLTDPATVDGSAPKEDGTSAAPSDGAPNLPDDVMELLASLGLVPVPQPVQPEGGASNATTPVAKGASQPGTANPVLAASTSGANAIPADVNPADTVAPATSTPAQAPVGHDADSHKTGESATVSKDAPAQSPVDSRSQLQLELQAQPAPVQPSLMQAAMHAPVANTTQGDGQQSGMGMGQDDSGHSRDHAGKPSALSAAAASDAPTLPQPVEIPNSVTTTVAAAAPPAAASVHPGEVVNQIAQQVDLYRLPGNKGVRIQLHPEDLGGVQVTLKYASGGNLELHISVEHAATGELVQAGMSQLRDALATQGFQPDRLVMSVSAPSAASGQMDFSANGNGSYRSDPGLNAFMQNGQSDQRGGAPQDDRAEVGWTASAERTATSEVLSPSSGVASTSRIDYRV